MSHGRQRVRLAALLIGLALPVAGCGSASKARTAVATGPPHVVMSGLAFSPTTVHARVGQQVTWTNRDNATHNVTYVSGPRFRSSGRISPGERYAIRLTRSGTIHLFCSLHPWMKATIDVAP